MEWRGRLRLEGWKDGEGGVCDCRGVCQGKGACVLVKEYVSLCISTRCASDRVWIFVKVCIFMKGLGSLRGRLSGRFSVT